MQHAFLGGLVQGTNEIAAVDVHAHRGGMRKSLDSVALAHLQRVDTQAATGDIHDAVEREAAGFHARVVQHECDHLDGILYPQRMTDHRLLMFIEEWQRNPIDLSALADDAEERTDG